MERDRDYKISFLWSAYGNSEKAGQNFFCQETKGKALCKEVVFEGRDRLGLHLGVMCQAGNHMDCTGDLAAFIVHTNSSSWLVSGTSRIKLWRLENFHNFKNFLGSKLVQFPVPSWKRNKYLSLGVFIYLFLLLFHFNLTYNSHH